MCVQTGVATDLALRCLHNATTVTQLDQTATAVAAAAAEAATTPSAAAEPASASASVPALPDHHRCAPCSPASAGPVGSSSNSEMAAVNTTTTRQQPPEPPLSSPPIRVEVSKRDQLSAFTLPRYNDRVYHYQDRLGTNKQETQKQPGVRFLASSCRA